MFKLFLALVFLSAAAQAKEPRKEATVKKTQAYERYAMEGNHFKCDFPKGWTTSRDSIADKVEKVYGAEAVGPRTKEGAPVRISVDYYSKENTLFKDSSEYLDRNTKEGILKIKEDKYGPAKDITVAGLKGKIFERETSIYLPPNNPMAVKVAIKEKVTVLAAKEGFYVLRYYAPAAMYVKHLSAYDKTLKSFEPGH